MRAQSKGVLENVRCGRALHVVVDLLVVQVLEGEPVTEVLHLSF